MNPAVTRLLTGPSLALALLGVLAVAVYWPGLGSPLLLDDRQVFAEIRDAIARGYFSLDLLMSHSGPLGRPLAMASFAVDAWWHGDDWAGWKATNVALHVLCGAALYGLFAGLARAAGQTPRAARELAFIAAALWLVHPLHVSTVLYTVQRMTELSSLLCIVGLWLYTQGRLALATGRGGIVRMAVALVMFTPLAALAKETGLMLPGFILALELTVFAHAGQPRPRWLAAGMLAGVVLAVVAGAFYLTGQSGARLFASYAARDFGMAERLMTEARVVVMYLRWILLPRRADYGFYHDDIAVTRSYADDWPALGALLLLLALAGAAWYGRRRWPLAAFGGALFLLGLALESSVFPLDLAFEHRTYLPAAGLALAVAVAMGRIAPSRLRRGVLVATLAVLLFATALRVLVWSDAGTLHHALFATHPTSERARATLAEWYVGQGEFDRALTLLDAAGGLSVAIHRQRVLCLRDGRPGHDVASVVRRVGEAAALSRFSWQTLSAIVQAVLDGRCAWPAATVPPILERLRREPLNRVMRYRLEIQDAHYSHAQGDVERALERLALAARLQRDDPFVHYLSAEWLIDRGEVEAARAALTAARRRGGERRFAAVDATVAALIAERAAARGP